MCRSERFRVRCELKSSVSAMAQVHRETVKKYTNTKSEDGVIDEDKRAYELFELSCQSAVRKFTAGASLIDHEVSGRAVLQERTF